MLYYIFAASEFYVGEAIQILSFAWMRKYANFSLDPKYISHHYFLLA